MTTKTRERLLTAEEFYHLPEPIEGGKMELAYGKVETIAPVGQPHSLSAGRIYRILFPFIEEHALGELHIELGYRLRRAPDLVRAPDVSFLVADQLASIAPEGFADTFPTLAVEVVSPDDRRGALLTKVGEYLDAGAPTVWVADPRTRTVTMYRQDGAARTFNPGEQLTSEEAGFAVTGFAVRVGDLFP